VERKLPDVYIMSKFEVLPSELKKYLPAGVKLKIVPTPDLKFNVDHGYNSVPQEAVQMLQNAEVLVIDGTCLAILLYDLPSAKWAQNTWAGVEIVMNKLDKSKPLPSYTLTRHADEYFGDLVSNYVLAQIVNNERKFFAYHDYQKLKKWSRPSVLPNFRVLRDLTVGILGSGNIGSAVGRLLKSGGSRVIAFVRHPRNTPSDSFDMAVTDLNTILVECDYICNVLPSTEYTRGLLDNDVLKNCKKNPVFINIGRGDIIKNSCIIKALRENWISRAILDVFKDEPLPEDSPLWTMPEVIITPHIGAMPRVEGIAKFVASNYMKYVNGEPLQNVVDWQSGY